MTAMEPSGLGPMGDLQLLATMLATDVGDLQSFARVLTHSLADVLPPAMVQVRFRRGLAGRLSGGGRPVEIVVHGPTADLALSDQQGVHAEERREVGGVVISRRSVELDVWLQLLAELISTVAARTAASVRAVEDFLRSGT